jgi:hypothetical protein
MLQGMRHVRQLVLRPAEAGGDLAANAAAAAELRCETAAAVALQQQLGTASEFATVQACHISLGFTFDSAVVNEPHRCLSSNSSQHCCNPPSSAATCSNAVHVGRSSQPFCTAPNEDILPLSRQATAHQSMGAAAVWLLATA